MEYRWPVKYRGTQGTAIVGRVRPHGGNDRGLEKVCGEPIAPTARSMFIRPSTPNRNPGAEQMVLKILFHPETGKLLEPRLWVGPVWTSGLTCWPWQSKRE